MPPPTAAGSESGTAAPPDPKAAPPTGSISRGGLLTGVVLVILNCYPLVYGDPPPFPNVIFLLFLLTAANALLRRLAPRLVLNSQELLAIYVMLAVQTCFSGVIYWIMGTISYGHWRDNGRQDVAAFATPYYSSWLIVRNPEAVWHYYWGQERSDAGGALFPWPYLREWLVPMLWWTLFAWALAAVLMGAAVLLSRQWIHHERLAFPVVELPFQMVSARSRFWHERLMWLGFGVAVGLELLNGLNYLYPTVPSVYVKRTNLGFRFGDMGRPWSGLGETNVSFYPFMIGLGFLVPLDLSTSIWVFYLFHKAEVLTGEVLGLTETSNIFALDPRDQRLGAGAAIVAAALWSSRAHLKRGVRLAFGGKSPLAEAGHAVSEDEQRQYRRALFALASGSLFIVAFLTVAGLAWWMGVVVLLAYTFVGLMIARIRCEFGFPMHDMRGLSGGLFLVLGAGSAALGDRNLALLGLSGSFAYFHHIHLLPTQLEGIKLADREGLRLGSLTKAILTALLVAGPVTVLVCLAVGYRIGAVTTPEGTRGLYLYESVFPIWLSDPYRKPNTLSLAIIAASFLFSCGLLVLRTRFLGWPLHPLGLALANSVGGVGDVVVAVFVASVAKALILRYFHRSGYERAVPFFLGLILGDFVMGIGWRIVGLLLRTPTYVFYL